MRVYRHLKKKKERRRNFEECASYAKKKRKQVGAVMTGCDPYYYPCNHPMIVCKLRTTHPPPPPSLHSPPMAVYCDSAATKIEDSRERTRGLGRSPAFNIIPVWHRHLTSVKLVVGEG